MNSNLKFRVWGSKFYKEPARFHYDCLIGAEKIYYKEEDYGGTFSSGEKLFCIENAIVQRFIGIFDKNGREIYEGDIIAQEKDLDKDCIYDDEYTYTAYDEIKIKNGIAFGDEDNIFELYVNADFKGSNHHLEVVGNIFENSELLK